MANGEVRRVEMQDTGSQDVPLDQPQRSTDEDVNPLGEETIKVRVRDGVEFFPQVLRGERATPGMEFDMPISQARAASMFVDEVASDGKLRTVPHEQQQNVGGMPRANLAGLARHERISALRSEEETLNKRLEQVRQQIAHEERATMQAGQPPESTQGGRPGEGGRGPARPPQGQPATPAPGTPGGVPVPPTPQTQPEGTGGR